MVMNFIETFYLQYICDHDYDDHEDDYCCAHMLCLRNENSVQPVIEISLEVHYSKNNHHHNSLHLVIYDDEKLKESCDLTITKMTCYYYVVHTLFLQSLVPYLYSLHVVNK